MIIKINPEDRLSVTGFPRPYERFFESSPKAKDPTVYEPIIYKCSDCIEEIFFEEKNFKKHSQLMFSNLKQDLQKAIDESTELSC